MADRIEQRLVECVREKRGRNGKRPGPAVHDDLCTVTDEDGRVRHQCTAEAPNELWLTDITGHRTTTEGKLYLCAVKDVVGNKIVGYSIDSRIKSSLAVNALEDAILMRGDVAGCVVHSDRGSQGGSSCVLWPATAWSARWAGSPPAETTPRWNPSSACYKRTSSTATPGPPASNCALRS